ncbi:alpha/beta hydrolase [Streptomyces albipurpureus]|uniref:Alpha/beta hydrolase family protein n=1 Tax=Streptomyces albipurpureus TaxID=2897419 RepID=A0ABT0UKV1_9ACTN|nr:alpha/beta hydrolase [Streptomyces sp. CWNU-1]MCM2388644.1 alpha/beta hydrolase family protein [Streptomyces sp. CWNU-1]
MRRYKRTLLAVALATTVVTGTAGWASGSAQRAVTGPPPGTGAWVEDRSLGRELPHPATADPRQVAAFFGGLSAGQREGLAQRHPLVVGNLDGVPVSLRYRANSHAVRGTAFERLAASGRQILAFDPRGRGQVAEVYGDLEGASTVSVIVPGADIDAGTFDREDNPYGTPAGMAKSLRTAAGKGSAVIAWTGYTTPLGVGLGAATGELAEAGAVRLTRFTQGLDAVGTPAAKLFCHSYGSVVCGLAAATGELTASDVVVLGSPGVRASSAKELNTRVWAAKSASDWISKVPNVHFLGLGHGSDPTAPSFGAHRLPAHQARGHSGYFAPGTDSLHAFAAIAKARPVAAATGGVR